MEQQRDFYIRRSWELAARVDELEALRDERDEHNRMSGLGLAVVVSVYGAALLGMGFWVGVWLG